MATLIHDTDWTGGLYGSPTPGAAGTTTGAGDGWIDVAGGSATVSGNLLHLAGNDLARPASETTAIRDQKGVVYFVCQYNLNTTIGWQLRRKNTPNYSYMGQVRNGHLLRIYGLNASPTFDTGEVDCTTQPTAGDILRLEMSVSGASPTTTLLELYNVTTGGGKIGTLTATDSYSNLQSAGIMEMTVPSGSFSIQRAQTYNLAGAPVTTTATPTGASIGVTTAISFGTAPYTVKTYRSPTFGFTPGSGNLVNTATTSGTSSTYTDTAPTAGTVYYYVASATDSAGTPVTNVSAQVTAALTGATINMVGIGDSIMLGGVSGGGPTPFISMQTRLQIGLNATVNYINKAVSGQDSTDWQAGAGNGYLAAAIAAITAGAYVPIMLGTNDVWGSKATTAATYQSNMTAICNAVVTAGGIAVLMTPPYPTPGSNSNQWDTNSPGRLQAMIATLDSIANGTTILRGDKQAFGYFANHPEQKTDGIHPNGPASPNAGTGSAVLGELWANGLAQTLAAKSSGGSGGGTSSGGNKGYGFGF